MKISIDGNIGCGKTSVLSRLCQELRLPVFLEPINEWQDWLSLYYKDPVRWGFSFNVKVLLSFNKWANNTFTALYERSPISNRHVFADLQRDDGNMNALEYDVFKDLFQNLGWCPDVVIYVRTDPEVCMERMQKRGRDCESAVPYDYIKAIHQKYEVLFTESNNLPCKVIVVNGNQTADQVYKEVCEIVQRLR